MNKIPLLDCLTIQILYSRKVWLEEILENLANHERFTKLKPSKFLLTVITFWLNLFIRQTFFAKCSKQVILPNFTPTKLSCYMVVISHKIFNRKCDNNLMKSEYKGNLTLMILDNCMFLCLQS